MNTRRVIPLFFLFCLTATSLFAQTPRLQQIIFSKDGIPTKQVGRGVVIIELVFDSKMDITVAPTIQFSLDESYSLTFPAVGKWQDSTSWQGRADITDIVPSTADGEYLFRISGARDANGILMTPVFSIDLNTTLFICRSGKADISVDSLQFGRVAKGIPIELQLTLRNTSCAELTITLFSIDAPFSLLQNIQGVKLNENDSLQITVRFHAFERASYQGSLHIRTDESTNPDHYIYLSGTAIGPEIVTSPSDIINFGKVRLGSSATRTVLVHNREAADPSLSDTLRVRQIISQNDVVFQVDSTSLTVSPGETGEFRVTFVPQQPISYGPDTLRLISNDPTRSTLTLTMIGNAIDETPPAQVRNLTATGIDSTKGFITRVDTLEVCWDNPPDPSGISKVFWKFVPSAQPPTSPEDMLNGGSSVPLFRNGRYCAYLPLLGRLRSGRWYCYVWLSDSSGNSGYRNALETVFVYDVSPPLAPSLLGRSIPAAQWFARNRIFNITIEIPVDTARGVRDGAEMRWKYRTRPAHAADFNGKYVFNALQRSSATVTIPFTDPALCGEDSLFIWLADSAGNSDGNNLTAVPYRFDICPPKIVRSHDNGSTAELGVAFRDTLTITELTAVDTVWFEYRFGGAESSEPPRPLERIPDTDQYILEIPQPGVTRRGVEYRVVARDTLGNQGDGPESSQTCLSNGETWMPIATRVLNEGDFRIDSDGRPVPLISGTDSTTYQLVSVPYQLDSSAVMKVVGDDLGMYDDKMWRLFDYDAENKQWLEGENARNFVPGRAYFIITRKENIVIDSGPGRTVKTVCPDSIRLYEGWNLIATPFNFPIHKTSLSLVNSTSDVTLRSYERGWNITDVLEPWRGYAIYVTSAFGTGNPTPIWLVIQPKAAPGRVNKVASLDASLQAGEWLLRLEAEAGQVHDRDNWLGVRALANEGFDDLELAEPPTIGKHVMLSFPHPEWEQPTEQFSTDLRPISTQDGVWQFVVSTNQENTPVELSFSLQGDVAAAPALYLIDEKAGLAQDLRSNTQYTFISGKHGTVRYLKVVAGDREFVQEVAGEIELVPGRFELLPNYPNPFNPTTTIRYNLPEASRVSLHIYDQLGRLVRTLIDNQVEPAGYYSRPWDGRDSAGKTVASGIYFAKITAGQHVAVGKMVVIR